MPPYKDKRNGRWRFRGEFASKPYSGSAAKGNNTRAAAIAMEREMLKRLERRVFTGIMPTVADFVERFLEFQKAHTATLTHEAQSYHLELHVVPALGPRRLDSIGVMEIDELKLAWTKKGTAATTTNTRLGTLRRMLSLAFEWKILVEVPKFRWMPTDTQENEIRFLSDADAAALVAAAKPAWQSMILVALRTGLRIGELRGLQWTDIDFERRVIRVSRNEPGRPDVEASSTKSGKGRSVPLTEDAYQCLTAMPRDSKWVWHSVDNRSRKPVYNRPRSQSGCKHGIEAAALVAKLDITGWHMLRHTYASHLVMRAVPLKVVQELLGHASIKQTEVYAHLAPGFAHHAAVAALDYPLVPSSAAPPALPPVLSEEDD